MAILDGKPVDDDVIDPAKHRFIGLFRYPRPPTSSGYIVCSCGTTLQYLQEGHEHWQRGHFDSPQYETRSMKIETRHKEAPTCLHDNEPLRYIGYLWSCQDEPAHELYTCAQCQRNYQFLVPQPVVTQPNTSPDPLMPVREL